MDWFCGFLTGCIMGGVLALAASPTGSKAPVDMYKKDWDPAQHPLEAEGEALDPQQEGGTAWQHPQRSFWPLPASSAPIQQPPRLTT